MAAPQAGIPPRHEIANEAALQADRRQMPELPRATEAMRPEGGESNANPDLREAIRQDQLSRDQQQARLQAEEEGDETESPEQAAGASPQKAVKGPGGMAASAASKGGIDPKRAIGIGLIRGCWATLWLSAGHTMYFLAILFFAGWASKYVRQYIPEVGMEWIPQQVARRTSKIAFLPLKFGEIVAIAFLLFWVLMFDLILMAILSLLLAFFMTVKSTVGSIL